jgi:hypothetical protein
MINALGRSHLRLPKNMLFLGALALAQALSVANASDAAASKTFSGHWKYQQTCGSQHSATLTLSQAGDDVTGDWTDGTRLSGSDGSLKGSVRDGKLFVRYCGGDKQSGYAVCPTYEAEDSDYFIRNGKDLVWYRMVGKKGAHTFDKYVVLHPIIKGKPLPVDDHCTDNEN